MPAALATLGAYTAICAAVIAIVMSRRRNRLTVPLSVSVPVIANTCKE
jgi:hypothetical protein